MKFKTKTGFTKFAGIVAIEEKDFEIAKVNGKFVAVDKKNNVIGEIVGETVTGAEGYKSTDTRKKFKLENLLPTIDPTSLLGKDPTTLTKDELVALTQYLQELASGKASTSTEDVEEAATEKAGKKKKKKPVEPVIEEEDDEDEEDEDEETVELPEGVETVADLEKKGAKELWKIAKPLEIDGINSRTIKADLVKALTEYFELEGEDEDEDEVEDELTEDSLPEDMDSDEEDEDEEDEEEEEEYEDDEEEEDTEEDEDDDDSEEDEEESDEDDDEDEDDEEDEEDEDEDEEDELTPEDIDALEEKSEIMAIIKKHNIEIPSKKLNVRKVKQVIKDALFGDQD